MVLIAALAAAPAAGEQPKKTFSETTRVTAVDLILDVRGAGGETPLDLAPSDFEVLEEGRPVTVIGVEPLAGATVAGGAGTPPVRGEPAGSAGRPWRTVIYVDQMLSSSRSIRQSCEALAAQAGALTDLGPVEVVIANPSPRAVLRPTRSAPLLEQTLTRLAREAPGRDALRRIRRQYVDALLLKGEVDGTGVPTVAGRGRAGPAGADAGDLGSIGQDGPTILRDGARFRREQLARVSLEEEMGLLQEQHDALMAWFAGYLEPGPKALLLVSDGYDLDPRNFYLTGAIGGSRFTSLLGSLLQDREVGRGSETLAETLAASGWVVVSLAVGGLESGQTMSADMSGKGRVGDLIVSRGDTVSELPSALVLQPLGPLNRLADATGGETLTGVHALPRALERLGERVLLTYQVSRPPDGTLRRVEVHALRPGLEVTAPRWSGTTPPEGVSAARARRLLAGGADRGELPVVAAVALEPGAAPEGAKADPPTRRGKLQARVDLRPLAASLEADATTPVRVTIAASFADGAPFVRHDRIEGQSLAGLDAWTYGLPIALPPNLERLSVVVEELTTGAWGGALAAVVEGEPPPAVSAAGASDADPAASPAGAGAIPRDLLPGRKAILLVPPPAAVVRGRTLLEPVVADPAIARVEYRLDGEPVATASKPPFSARVDFGALPAPRRVEAVAFAAGGREIGRDALSVNEGVGAFKVRIIEPRAGDRVGAVDVEAEVQVPPGSAALERVEVLWNGERTATLFEPPFRARVYVPPEAPVGWVAVAAHRADGSVAEDVVFLNGTGPGEEVDVRLVELFTVVEDRMSRPVRGLGEDDFRIFEDGRAQALSDFRDGAEMPLSLALVFDTSASMTPVMRSAQTAAIDFLLLALRPRDRAQVVAFDARPRLVQAPTGDRSELVEAIAGLQPRGTSALCDALVFTLVQMQRIPGRRALVVLTDGVGRDERVDFSTCLRFVQRSGVPIYAILLAGDDPTAAGSGGVDADKLGRLVAAVGGRLFVTGGAAGLGAVYRTVIEELRSQYLLTYYPEGVALGAAAEGGWREIEVDVDRPGLVARTLAGYYP